MNKGNHRCPSRGGLRGKAAWPRYRFLSGRHSSPNHFRKTIIVHRNPITAGRDKEWQEHNGWLEVRLLKTLIQIRKVNVLT